MAKKIEKPVIYSALEVANICGVVNQTAINWINSGYLKAFKTPGGQYRVYPDDLADFMSERNMHIPMKLLSACTNRAAYDSSTLLVIDDDKTFNTLVARFLRERFPELEIIQAFDGFELCRKINADNSYGKPAVIVVTALEDKEDENRIVDLGIENFFRKPLKLELLADAVDRVFKD